MKAKKAAFNQKEMQKKSVENLQYLIIALFLLREWSLKICHGRAEAISRGM